MRNPLASMALALSLLSLPAAATYYDTFTIHGNACTSTGSASPTVSQWGPYAGATAVDVSCPLVGHNHNYSAINIFISGYNRSPSDLVSCTLTATDYYGSIVASKKVELPGNVSPSVLTRFGSVNYAPGSYYYSLTCHLPAQTNYGLSHLTSVYVYFPYEE